MSQIPFSKYHGLGNDVILIDAVERPDLAGLDWRRLAPAWCDRHVGVGGDGVLVVGPIEDAGVRVRIVNADGSDGGVCGNGLRCAALHLVEHHGAEAACVRLVTARGATAVRCGWNGGRFAATVDMGEPILEAGLIPVLAETGRVIDAEPVAPVGSGARMTCVSMGNPHAVFFVERVGEVDLARVGPMVERHPRFPERVNVQVAEAVSPTLARVRTWERGAGLTRACGTGACSVLVAGVLTGRLRRSAEVELEGGRLTVEWNEASNRVLLTGPAERVFGGWMGCASAGR
jgi:diaminopimelate epimerase